MSMNHSVVHWGVKQSPVSARPDQIVESMTSPIQASYGIKVIEESRVTQAMNQVIEETKCGALQAAVGYKVIGVKGVSGPIVSTCDATSEQCGYDDVDCRCEYGTDQMYEDMHNICLGTCGIQERMAECKLSSISNRDAHPTVEDFKATDELDDDCTCGVDCELSCRCEYNSDQVYEDRHNICLGTCGIQERLDSCKLMCTCTYNSRHEIEDRDDICLNTCKPRLDCCQCKCHDELVKRNVDENGWISQASQF